MRWQEGGSSNHWLADTITTLSPLEAAVRAAWRARLAVVVERSGWSEVVNTRQDLTSLLSRPAWTGWGRRRVLL